MVAMAVLAASVVATLKALWVGGSPFAGFTALWPTNDEGKYVIEAEGIRLAFTNRNGGTPTNLWMNDTNGDEIDILLGLDMVEEYDDYVGQLGGTIGMYCRLRFSNLDSIYSLFSDYHHPTCRKSRRAHQ